MNRRKLGGTGLEVSVLGFGAFKIGRNEGIKYPAGYALPSDRDVVALLEGAAALGVNLIDTAPAYGTSEERLGALLGARRKDFVLCTKVGEEFRGGASTYDFSAKAVEESVARSLRRLRTDRVDCVLLHCPKADLDVLEKTPAVAALEALKRKGYVRAVGASVHTVEAGLRAVGRMDVVMVEPSLAAVLEAASRAGKGALVKKGLRSGQVPPAERARTLAEILARPGVSSLVVGTLSLAHLRENAEAAS